MFPFVLLYAGCSGNLNNIGKYIIYKEKSYKYSTKYINSDQ